MQLLESKVAEMTAVVQHGTDLSDLQAAPLANDGEFTLVESGESIEPRDVVCVERDHEFDVAMLRDAPTAATCTRCRYPKETIQSGSHRKLSVCGGCESVAYERELEYGNSRVER